MKLGIDASMDAQFFGVGLRSGNLSSEGSVKADRYHFLRELSRFKMANEQLNS